MCVKLSVETINVSVSIGGPETSASIITKIENDLIATVSGVYYNVVELSYDEDQYPEAWYKDRERIMQWLTSGS